MGLLDKFVSGANNFEVPSNPTRKDIQKSLAIIGIGAIGADGHFDNNEIVELTNSLIGMPLYSNVTAREILIEADKLYSKNRSLALDWAVNIAIKTNWSETALTLAASLIFTDGVVDDGEAEFFDQLQSDLGVTEIYASNAVQVFSTLYREFS